MAFAKEGALQALGSYAPPGFGAHSIDCCRKFVFCAIHHPVWLCHKVYRNSQTGPGFPAFVALSFLAETPCL